MRRTKKDRDDRPWEDMSIASVGSEEDFLAAVDAKIKEVDRISTEADLLDDLERSNAAREQARADAKHARSEAAALKKRLKQTQDSVAAIEAEVADLRRRLESAANEIDDAREVGRRLWMSMPREGRLALFESDSAWLPDWVRGE